ncbi:MAG: M56 family metallopeptidase [Bacteroidaceae bacterium]|nr:M56 family metallopeptidase [Bacteroidaceae bacterium]
MLEYVIKSSLLLAALYGGFALLLSRETFHRFNRLALLSVLVASMVLPLVELSIRKPEFFGYKEVELVLSELKKNDGILALPKNAQVQAEANPYIQYGRILALPKGAQAQAEANPSEHFDAPQTSEDEAFFTPPKGGWGVRSWVGILYLLGLLASLAFFFVGLFRLFVEIKGGVHTKDELGNTVVIHADNFAPFSFLHYIIMSASDYEHLRRPILAHEQAHIRLGHTYDLLLLEAVKAVQWFNPFVYLLGRDLKAVHEYEADDAVLSNGIDAKTYQLLLVTKAVGSRLQTVCNSLSHHSLKKRIKMMQTHKSNRWLMGKALILPALMALALVSWAKRAPSDSPKGERLSRQELPSSGEVREGTLPVEVQVPGLGIVTTDEVRAFSEGRMLNAFIPNDNAKDFIRKHGPAIAVSWLKGTWVVKGDNSFIEEHPDCGYPMAFHTKYYDVMLDGKPLDVNNLPDLPASALKKVEIQLRSKGEKLTVNLITKPVQIPAGVKGNINPELTILLTGTPPKDCGTKTSIWERRGNFDGFSWKNYTICSWKWDVDDISVHLKEVAIRSDHSVRINVCKGVPQGHIDRITRLMKECGITNYRFVRQE